MRTVEPEPEPETEPEMEPDKPMQTEGGGANKANRTEDGSWQPWQTSGPKGRAYTENNYKAYLNMGNKVILIS